jgi:hypothetical protein
MAALVPNWRELERQRQHCTDSAGRIERETGDYVAFQCKDNRVQQQFRSPRSF